MADSARWLVKDRLEPWQSYGARRDAETRLVVVVVAVAVAVSSRPVPRSDHFHHLRAQSQYLQREGGPDPEKNHRATGGDVGSQSARCSPQQETLHVLDARRVHTPCYTDMVGQGLLLFQGEPELEAVPRNSQSHQGRLSREALLEKGVHHVARVCSNAQQVAAAHARGSECRAHRPILAHQVLGYLKDSAPALVAPQPHVTHESGAQSS